MIKKTVCYTNFKGQEVKKDLYFNMTVLEVQDFVKANIKNGGSSEDALSDFILKATNEELAIFFKDFILASYGEVSEDGEHFKKSEEIKSDFQQSLAFNELFNMIFKDGNLAKNIVDGATTGIPKTKESDLSPKTQKALKMARLRASKN